MAIVGMLGDTGFELWFCWTKGEDQVAEVLHLLLGAKVSEGSEGFL